MSPRRIFVLLVGDSPAERSLFRIWLAESGTPSFQVVACNSLAAGIELATSREFDVVLLDLSLPDSRSLESCAAMVGAAPEIPLVLLTRSSKQQTALAAVRCGAQDCLPRNQINAASLRRAICCAVLRHRRNAPDMQLSGADASSVASPCWDRERRELRVGRAIIKRFRQPSANQESILNAFEEEGWPPRIDDPLPRKPEYEPKTRLRTTIKSLNRNQQHALLRFRGDGSGEAVLWELQTGDGD